MKEYRITLPELALYAGTRGLIGVGVGLLLSGRIQGPRRRRAVGWTLLATGALSTIPLALKIFRRHRPKREIIGHANVERGREREREIRTTY
jgi:hypothetical protein